MKTNFSPRPGRLAAALTLLILFSLSAKACDICGMAMGVTPFDNKSMLSFNHRYRAFDGYPAMNQSSALFPAGAYRLAHGGDPSVLHGGAPAEPEKVMQNSDFESFKVFELKGRWFVHRRLELNILLPLIENKSKMGDESFRAAGAGDMSVFAGWHVLERLDNEKLRSRVIVGLGIKLPTGRADHTFPDGDRVSVMMQTGTGSTDGFAYVTYTSAARSWRWGITSLGKYNGENKYNEQVCPSTVNSAFAAYQLTAGRWIFLPQVQVYQEYTKGVRIENVLQEGTAMNMTFAGPGVEIYFGNFGFNVCAQLPVQQRTDEMNMKAAGRVTAGITYSFDQVKYLLN